MAAGGRDMRTVVLISSSQLASSVICTTHTYTHTARERRNVHSLIMQAGERRAVAISILHSPSEREREEDV